MTVLILFIIIPGQLYAKPFTDKLYDNYVELTNILADLSKISSEEDKHEPDSRVMIIIALSGIARYIYAELEMCLCMSWIKEEKKIDYIKNRIRTINEGKEYINSGIGTIQTFYGFIKNKATLHLLDKAKGNLRSSLESLDEGLKFLELTKITYPLGTKTN